MRVFEKFLRLILHLKYYYNNNRPLGRPKRRWEDNIKMDLQEVGWTGSSWPRIGIGGGHL
jgi:hypothetical protein